ncbi:hypothetical protein AURDEDRAFT_159313 [Auricularia subglabra TFB-10046 SS5]|nr:hypothetical protein AURDEDRAFT_159313 [Auricularia subglabra TFB-10046 SS5]
MEVESATRRSPRKHKAPTGPPPRNRRRARQAVQVNAAPVNWRTSRSTKKLNAAQVSSPSPLAPRKPRRARKAQVQVSALGQAPDVQPVSHAALTALSEPVALSSQIDPSLDEMAAELFPSVSHSFGESVQVHSAHDELQNAQDLMPFDNIAYRTPSPGTQTQAPDYASNRQPTRRCYWLPAASRSP